MARIALGIEYNGAAYFGWQRQRNVAGVQQELEQALTCVAQESITVFCAGRTDAGVHATNQIVHFDTGVQRPQRAWTMGVNANLPDNIAVKWSQEVPDDFHARFSAVARRYRYIICNQVLRPGLFSDGVTHFYQPLDANKMHEAAQVLVGENDFSAFRASLCQSKSPHRNLHYINVSRLNNFVIIDVKANAFLHHMVRNITGSLMKVGIGEYPTHWIAELLAAKDRTKAAATAKPNGLYLVEVEYPGNWPLPDMPVGPLFLSDAILSS